MLPTNDEFPAQRSSNAESVSISNVILKYNTAFSVLTHWGRVTHIWVSKLTIICSDNGLSLDRPGIFIIRNLRRHFSKILSEINLFSFKKMHLKMSSGIWRPFCFGPNVLNIIITWWWVLYSCRNCLLRQKCPCFDRKSPYGNSCCWTYPLYKIFRAKIAIKWSVCKLCKML